MLFIVIIGLLLACFSGLFLLEGVVAFKDRPVTILNLAIATFSTIIGVLMTYITVCFIAFAFYHSTGSGQELLILLGF